MEAAKKGGSVYALSTFQTLERYRNTGFKDIFLRDPHLRGFGVRVTPSNTKSFFVEGRHDESSSVSSQY